MGLREDNVGTLEDAASKRKAKLLELRNRKRKTEIGDSNSEEQKDAEEILPTPHVLFRNYRPSTAALTDGVLDTAQPADVDRVVQEQLHHAAEHASAMQQVELSSLAPRKVTFDLKRCIAPRLDRLERATDRAIAELIRDRLREEAREQGRGEDLLAAVNAGAMVKGGGQEEGDE